MFCAFHKERLACETCSLCGKPVCPDCHRVVNGKSFCVRCFPSVEIREKKYKPRNPLVAALLGIFPGLGQVYNGQLLKAFFIFFTSWLVIPWLYGIYDAYAIACQINDREVDVNPSPALLAGCLLSVILIFGMFSGGPFFMLRGLPYMIDRLSGKEGQTQVFKIFKEIAAAVNAYREDHGSFPEEERELYFGEIPYLKNIYCGAARGNYYFECDFSSDGYHITAMPLRKGLPGYRMKPGVVEMF
jgi:hypothetical protein